MAEAQKPNKPLFSRHYLEHRLPDCPEWREDGGAVLAALQDLYGRKKALLPTLNEAQTETEFIQPALEILGFSLIPQVTTRGRGRAERPDYALFTDSAAREAAYPLQGEESAFYPRVSAIAEAKYWERPLSEKSPNDGRDLYSNRNPSFQITSYLDGTGVDWGILTNGREWRLYYRLASSRTTEFYPVDLAALLEAGDGERFKYFWLFFRSQALVKDVQGRNFLERVREGSATYATQVGQELKTLVFERVFPDLAGGFAADATRRGQRVTAPETYGATLSFLYKLLFLLYAEARNLLPLEGDYRRYSLIQMTQDAARQMTEQRRFSQTSTGLYDQLLNLFQIIDRGDPALGVPRYNGGLFHFNFVAESDRGDYGANYFLASYKLTDAILAPALDRLARFEGLPIDYGFLGVRQLGSIYEGLLEYRLVIEDAVTGQAHLENDKGERKATGSYYTPDYIVKYIVRQTLAPILAERRGQFELLMEQIAQLQRQLEDGRLGAQARKGLFRDLERLERRAQGVLLEIKVCDPAMGSGHFLVEAVDFLTDELISILDAYPDYNPVLGMLERTRESILENLAGQGISINPDRLEPTQLLQRVVMKRCIYGVDLNPMAVELAKVSLWLHSFTIGAPLSFLDHHLRCGNSLIGATAREAEAAMSQESGGQLTLLSGPFVGLLRAAETIRGVSVLSDATFVEVERSESLFRSFDALARPYKRLLDVYVARFFGVKGADDFLRVMGTGAITSDPEGMREADRAIYDSAGELSRERRFFHWDLEFPEVFIDLETASWQENPGFDAVVGNPPYIRSIRLKDSDSKAWAYYPKIYQSAEKREFDIYLCFTEKGLTITNNQGHLGMIVPNKWFTTKVGESLRQLLSAQKSIEHILDFGSFQVFENATTYTCLLFLTNLVCEKIKISLLEDAGINNQPLPDIRGNWKIGSIENKTLDDKAWIFKLGPSGSLIEKLKAFSCLEEIATVFSGVGTRADEVFIMEQIENNYYSRSLNELVSIEEELMQPALTGRDIDSHFCTTNGYLLFPYKIRDKKSEIINLSEMKTQYPKAWEYLNNPLNEAILKGRDKGEFRNRKDWYGYGRPQNMNLLGLPKIVLPDVAEKAEFAYDAEGRYIIDTCYGVLINKEVEISKLALTSILNSYLMTFFLRQTGTDLRGGYFRMKTAYLNPFPVRKINFTTPAERRQQGLENLIELYQNYQTTQNPEPLLAQIDHHLKQDPEEADIIHDLLAHLAEQMIQLNQEKQTEIKGFRRWLERRIGCSIDDLSNKSKLKNYPGDYYKQEPHLTLDDLLAILKKNKKKIAIDPGARQEQETLETEYQASLDKLLPLKIQLALCDQLIDQIVYKLYDLTPEEIAIVEGRESAPALGKL